MGQACSGLAIGASGAMLVTTSIRIQTGNVNLLPPEWLMIYALFTSGSNLGGFILLTYLGARNADLQARKHKLDLDLKDEKFTELGADNFKKIGLLESKHAAELESKTQRVSALEAQLRGAGLAPVPLSPQSELSPVEAIAAGAGLFQRRHSIVSAAETKVDQPSNVVGAVLATEGSAHVPPASR